MFTPVCLFSCPLFCFFVRSIAPEAIQHSSPHTLLAQFVIICTFNMNHIFLAVSSELSNQTKREKKKSISKLDLYEKHLKINEIAPEQKLQDVNHVAH